MKNASTIHTDEKSSSRMLFEPRLDDRTPLDQEPRLYPQRKRAWDKLMSDIDDASSTLRISRKSVNKGQTSSH